MFASIGLVDLENYVALGFERDCEMGMGIGTGGKHRAE